MYKSFIIFLILFTVLIRACEIWLIKPTIYSLAVSFKQKKWSHVFCIMDAPKITRQFENVIIFSLYHFYFSISNLDILKFDHIENTFE